MSSTIFRPATVLLLVYLGSFPALNVAALDDTLRTVISGIPGSEIRIPLELDSAPAPSRQVTLPGLDPRIAWTLVTPEGTGKEIPTGDDGSLPFSLVLSLPPGLETGSQHFDLLARPGDLVQRFTLRVLPAQSFELSGPASVPPVPAGGSLTLPITVLNSGQTDLTDLALSVDAPRGWTVELSPSGPIAQLHPGDSAAVTLAVTVTSTQPSGLATIAVSGDAATLHGDLQISVDVRRKPRVLYALTALIALIAASIFTLTRKHGRR